MYVLRKPNGELTKDYAEILNIQYCFYKDLYDSDSSVHFDIVNRSGISLEEDVKSRFENPVTKD